MNLGTFAGNLGRSAELKQVGGQSVLNFSLAVKTGWGEREKTLWVDCALWGDRASKLEQFLTKGCRVTVSGDVDLREFDKRDGTRGASLTCNVQRLTLQSPRGERTEDAPPAQDQPAATRATATFDDSDQIPF